MFFFDVGVEGGAGVMGLTVPWNEEELVSDPISEDIWKLSVREDAIFVETSNCAWAKFVMSFFL